MDAELLLLALCTGLGLGFMVLAVRAILTAVRLLARGLCVTGRVTARVLADRRRGGLVRYSDHLGRELVLDPGPYASWCGLPPVGDAVPVVYVRERPTASRLWTLRHLLAPSFWWFLSSTVVFGTAVTVTS